MSEHNFLAIHQLIFFQCKCGALTEAAQINIFNIGTESSAAVFTALVLLYLLIAPKSYVSFSW